MAEQLIIGPALALGAIIGLYEMLVIHRDVQVASHRMGHSIHALLLSILFVFSVMNVNFMLNVIPPLQTLPVVGNEHAFRALIGLIAAIKIHGVSKAIQSGGAGVRGLGETWFHSILIGGLIAGSHYVYPFVEPMLPQWIKF